MTRYFPLIGPILLLVWTVVYKIKLSPCSIDGTMISKCFSHWKVWHPLPSNIQQTFFFCWLIHVFTVDCVGYSELKKMNKAWKLNCNLQSPMPFPPHQTHVTMPWLGCQKTRNKACRWELELGQEMLHIAHFYTQLWLQTWNKHQALTWKDCNMTTSQ
jgi:hypothetical protein